jgi:hypothetical protein
VSANGCETLIDDPLADANGAFDRAEVPVGRLLVDRVRALDAEDLYGRDTRH